MRQEFKDFLFGKHILVADEEVNEVKTDPYEESFAALTALAHTFGIRVNKNPMLANQTMIRDAERNLGKYVPESFYRGFPESVLELTPDQLLHDQIYHYVQTYGMGWFEEPGHSMLENFERMAFQETAWDPKCEERCEPKDFIILNEIEAVYRLLDFTKELSGSSRPLNRSQTDLLIEAYRAYPGFVVLNEEMPCKKTVVTLMYDLRKISLARYLQLSDIIKLVDYIQYSQYRKENITQLNLKNRDRKFISDVIHEIFKLGNLDIPNCYTRRKDWKGLLHHLHFKPLTVWEERFIKDIRNKNHPNTSTEALFEAMLKLEKPGEAMEVLVKKKGVGAGLRNLNYVLSRTKSDEEVEEVFSCLE